jgi:hypothetical protein
MLLPLALYPNVEIGLICRSQKIGRTARTALLFPWRRSHIAAAGHPGRCKAGVHWKRCVPGHLRELGLQFRARLGRGGNCRLDGLCQYLLPQGRFQQFIAPERFSSGTIHPSGKPYGKSCEKCSTTPLTPRTLSATIRAALLHSGVSTLPQR